MAYYSITEAEQLMSPVGNDGIGNDLGPVEVPGYVTWHARPYPTRFHGGIWKRPVFGLPTVREPTAVFSPTNLNGLGSGCGACSAVGETTITQSLIYTALGLLAVGGVAWVVNKWVL